MTAEPPSTTGTDVETISKLLSLRAPPQKARWRKSLMGEPGLGPTDWKLIAVLEYSAADAPGVVASLKKLPAGTKLSLEPAEDAWLDPAVRAAMGAGTLYDAAPLGRPPLASGSIVRLKDGTTFVLVMITS